MYQISDAFPRPTLKGVLLVNGAAALLEQEQNLNKRKSLMSAYGEGPQYINECFVFSPELESLCQIDHFPSSLSKDTR